MALCEVRGRGLLLWPCRVQGPAGVSVPLPKRMLLSSGEGCPVAVGAAGPVGTQKYCRWRRCHRSSHGRCCWSSPSYPHEEHGSSHQVHVPELVEHGLADVIGLSLTGAGCFTLCIWLNPSDTISSRENVPGGNKPPLDVKPHQGRLHLGSSPHASTLLAQSSCRGQAWCCCREGRWAAWWCRLLRSCSGSLLLV